MVSKKHSKKEYTSNSYLQFSFSLFSKTTNIFKDIFYIGLLINVKNTIIVYILLSDNYTNHFTFLVILPEGLVGDFIWNYFQTVSSEGRSVPVWVTTSEPTLECQR